MQEQQVQSMLNLQKYSKNLYLKNQNELDYLIALPDNLLLLIFENGEIIIADAKTSKVKISRNINQKKIKQPQLYDKDHLLFISQKFQKIQLLNLENLEILEEIENQIQGKINFDFNIQLPSEICLSKDLRNTQNLKNFYNDGVKISFLSQSKTIISLEIVDMLVPENQKISNQYTAQKFYQEQNQNEQKSNEKIMQNKSIFQLSKTDLTKEKINANKTMTNINNKEEYLFIKSYSEKGELNKKWIKIKKNNQRPFISPLNQDSLVSIWHAQSPLKLMIWDIFSEKINNFSFTFQESFIQKFEIISIIPFTRSENEFNDFKILVFGNGDQMPFYAFISVTQQGEYYDIQKDIYELNYFEEEWNLLDIQYYDEENSVVIWERNTIEGNYIDIFDLLQQKVIFTQKIQDDQSQDCFEINKVTSLDGKYIIGYDPNFQENIEDNTEKNQQECENNNQIKRQIPYTLTFLQYDQYVNNNNEMQYDNQMKKLNQTK